MASIADDLSVLLRSRLVDAGLTDDEVAAMSLNDLWRTALDTDSTSDFVADPTGGATTDAEARAAINDILDILIAHGLMADS